DELRFALRRGEPLLHPIAVADPRIELLVVLLFQLLGCWWVLLRESDDDLDTASRAVESGVGILLVERKARSAGDDVFQRSDLLLEDVFGELAVVADAANDMMDAFERPCRVLPAGPSEGAFDPFEAKESDGFGIVEGK